MEKISCHLAADSLSYTAADEVVSLLQEIAANVNFRLDPSTARRGELSLFPTTGNGVTLPPAQFFTLLLATYYKEFSAHSNW